MAVTFTNGSTSRSGALYVDYPENILVVPELNGRHEATEIETLAADIHKNGQNTPVLIRKNDQGQPVLVYGHRRWRAVKYINDKLLKPGEQKVQLQCNYASMSDLEAFTAAITENRFRKDVTPMDDCDNINRLVKRFKATLETIAGIYFPEAATAEAKAEALRWVKTRAGLEELAPEAAEGVRSGEIKVTAAAQLAKLSKDQQRKVVADSKSSVKGKSRIKVSSVLAAKPASAKKTSAAPSKAPAKAPAGPPVKAASSIYAAAEDMARAIDVWLTDATEKAEKGVIAAHKAYRALVPFRLAAESRESQAA